MPKVDVFNLNREKVGAIELADEVFAALGVDDEGAERVHRAVIGLADEDRRRLLLDDRRAGDAVL
mgnify:CR=1 FL=1